MANTLHRATCGTCGGSGVVYNLTQKYRTKNVPVVDDAGKKIGTETVRIEHKEVEEKTCTTCGGQGVR